MTATTAADACMDCTRLCQTCPIDSEWPQPDQTTLAATEAGGLAYAGADTATPHEAVAHTRALHTEWRDRRNTQAIYGAGGLFDHLTITEETGAAA